MAKEQTKSGHDPDPVVELAHELPPLWKERKALAERAEQTPAVELRLQTVVDTIEALESRITTLQATTLSGAHAQLLIAAGYIENFQPGDNVEELLPKLHRLLYSALLVLEHESGIDPESVAADSYIPDNPFVTIVSP